MTGENAISSRPPKAEAPSRAEVATSIPPAPKSPTTSGLWSTRGRRRSSLPAPPFSRSAAVRHFGKAVARSPAMHEVFDLLERVAATDMTVTLFGETGTGKDVFAHGLHESSPRVHGPLVVFDCGSVAPNLAESELLGHERGAFTGARSAHLGAFERAEGGTLFLDEVGELPLDLQPRLLRALESRRVRRVGGSVDRRVDVRVVAATHRDLRADVAAGRFREDLFFRLAVAIIKIPPLRERVDELPDMVGSLLRDLGRDDLRVSEPALAALRAHSWPGNVRELKNVLLCSVAFTDPNTVLEPRHLRIMEVAPAPVDGEGFDDMALGGHSLERIERAAIRQTLRQVAGNKTEAARILDISVSMLHEKLKKYSL
jgi:DNA-binding NtrC family response regulator